MTYTWQTVTGMVVEGRRNEGGEVYQLRHRAVEIRAYKWLLIQDHKPHCRQQFCLQALRICLN